MHEKTGRTAAGFQTVEKVVFIAEVYRFAQHQCLPCVRGGGPPEGGSEGLCSRKYVFA